ncbi:tryptophan-rich sensory protein [Salinibacterium sp. SYSU T00001]|uniref:tryptophan-rich sensory protein n=1 Tax=Homoserinimonas sedimenticola TaxID=2986805 RepID=UPI002235DB56|nr:tryptophan-rich sensory protein [Salinibacterium sedimenticola]MCW4385438.1 tryptophan-rich sensory protein [Salinibacterium sedimenticola]
MTRATAADTTRNVIVSASAVLAVLGGYFGSGAAGGTPVDQAAGGALQADATPIAPGGPAFSIWSVIYLGLVAYAVWQFLPTQRSARRHRRIGYLLAASMLLNAAWILSVQAGSLVLSIIVILALLAVLAIAFLIAVDTKPTTMLDAVITDGTTGLYLGWVSVATIANIAAALTAAGFDGGAIPADTWGSALAITAGIVGCGLALRGRGRIAPTLSLCWGLAWVAVARLTGDLLSMPTAVAAIVAVIAVLAVTLAARLTTDARIATT